MLNALYLSGPMTGHPEFNYPEFNRVAKILRQDLDLYVLNPTEHGMENETWENCLKFYIELLLTINKLKRIVFLPGWRESAGARIESMVGDIVNAEMFEYIQLDGGRYDLKPTNSFHIESDIIKYKELLVYPTGNLIPIGITGKLHSGKDSLADYMTKKSPLQYNKYSFARPMKAIAYDIFGFTHDQLHDPIIKEQTDDFWGITPRKFLQILGTDMFRDVFRDDVWIKFAEKDMLDNPSRQLIVPDVRFDNEAKFIKSKKGLLVEIKRDLDDAPAVSRAHTSENGVNSDFIDVVVQNNGSFEDLEAAATFIEVMLTTGVIKTPLKLGERL